MELNILVPGKSWIESESIDDDGYTSYKYGFNQECIDIGSEIIELMEKAETDLLAPLIGETTFPSMADMSLAPYWKH